MAKRTTIDYSKDRYGRLSVESRFRLNGILMFHVKCDCGSEFNVVAASVARGATRSCGCLRLEVVRKEFGHAAWVHILSDLKASADKRRLRFDLTDFQVKEIMARPCYYCGAPPKARRGGPGRYGYAVVNGIDRVDNKKGYTLDNSVSCCPVCNKMKQHFALNIFQFHCYAISQLHPMSFKTFDAAYKFLLRALLFKGQDIQSRGGTSRELLGFSWSLSPVPKIATLDFKSTAIPERQKIFEDYRDRELEWYQSGQLSASSAPSKYWLRLADEHGNIVSNYGHMVMTEQRISGMSAVDYVVKILKNDPDSRRAIVHYLESRHHTLNEKDVPCTVMAQLFIRDGGLLMHVYQRSCDAIKGLTYDVPWHCWLMHEIASRLNVNVQEFKHIVGSLHFYSRDLEVVKKILTYAGTASYNGRV